MSVLQIDYQSEDFPAGTIPNGDATLLTSWDDILWAAVTVGRPNRQYVFRRGTASDYEALFRWSLVRMALEQAGPAARRLRRTDAAKTLDPTEKGAVSYFLGMTFCKLFAAKLLDTPWLLHLDVFRDELRALLASRSRPDLIGQSRDGTKWHGFECKGRISIPDSTAKTRAKAQADRLISVAGISCSLHVGAFTYLRSDVLNFYWRDPEPVKPKPVEIKEIGEAWTYYYSPIAEILRQRRPNTTFEQPNTYFSVPEADLEISVHPVIAKAVLQSKWRKAREMAFEIESELKELGYRPDGIRIKAGDSWNRRFESNDSEQFLR